MGFGGEEVSFFEERLLKHINGFLENNKVLGTGERFLGVKPEFGGNRIHILTPDGGTRSIVAPLTNMQKILQPVTSPFACLERLGRIIFERERFSKPIAEKIQVSPIEQRYMADYPTEVLSQKGKGNVPGANPLKLPGNGLTGFPRV